MDWQAARGSRGARFKRPPRLLCGPELRTRQTAELYGGDAETVTALRDCDLGRWQGCRIAAVQESEPEALQGWLDQPGSAPHGGESFSQVGERVAAWLATLEQAPGPVVAVTHPLVIRAALACVLQSAAFNAIDVEPLSAIELRFNGRWRLRLPGVDLEENG